MKYAYAERVVKKIRKYLACNDTFKEMTKRQPVIYVGQDYCLESVRWQYYEMELSATRWGIFFTNHGKQMQVVGFRGFDDLLDM